MLKTHYENLQVTENAGAEVIRGAYRHLTQKWHPDKNPNNLEEAGRITNIVNRAYAVLSDPQLRKEHDDWIHSQRNQSVPTDSQRAEFSESTASRFSASPPLSLSGNLKPESASRFHGLLITVIGLHILLAIFSESQPTSLFLFFLAAYAILSFNLASTIGRNPWIYGALAIIPGVNFIAMLVLINATNKTFKAAGLKVGFFGGVKA